METTKIVLLCVIAAILFGIIHDQVTTRFCIEYFTIGHVPMFDTESPTLLALGWGTIATWWVGLSLGLPAAGLARIGRMPKLRASDLVRPVAIVMLAAAVASLVAGISGYFAARSGWIWLPGPLASRVPAEKHVPFLADLWAHRAAYAMGGIGGICVWVWIVRRRFALMKQA